MSKIEDNDKTGDLGQTGPSQEAAKEPGSGGQEPKNQKLSQEDIDDLTGRKVTATKIVDQKIPDNLETDALLSQINQIEKENKKINSSTDLDIVTEKLRQDNMLLKALYENEMSNIQANAAEQEKKTFVIDALGKAQDLIDSQEKYDKKMLEIKQHALEIEQKHFPTSDVSSLDYDQHKGSTEKGFQYQDSKDPKTKEFIEVLKAAGTAKKNKFLQQAEKVSQEYVQTSVSQQPLNNNDKAAVSKVAEATVANNVAEVAEDKKLRLPKKIEKLKIAISSFVDHIKDFSANKIDKEEFKDRIKNNWGAADMQLTLNNVERSLKKSTTKKQQR